MDSIDVKILSILQKDARISMRNLAKEIPMSVPATCERVRKLEDSGIITGYTIKVNQAKLGNTVNAFIVCSLRIGELESNIRWAKKQPQIVAAYTLAGRHALLLQVSCVDMQEYQELINTLYTCSVIENYIIIETIKDNVFNPRDAQV